MANVYSLNETTAADAGSTRHAAWRLTRVLKDAGWVVWGSSDGADFSVTGTDYWVSLAPLLSASYCWIALKHPNGDQGHCIQFGPNDQDLRYTYTQSGWSSTSVDDVTAPSSVTRIGYLIGNESSYNSRGFVNASHDASQAAVQVINVAAQPASEGGAFDFWCFDSSATPVPRSIVQYSPVYPVPGVSDPNVFFTNGPVELGSSGAVMNYQYYGIGKYGGHFCGFDSNADFVSLSLMRYTEMSSYPMYNIANGFSGDSRVLVRPGVFQATAPYSMVGVVKNMRFGVPDASLRFYDGGARLNLYSNAISHSIAVMWDTNVDDVTVDRSGSFSLPSSVATTDDFEYGDINGTLRLPGNGYHRSRRRPRGVI